MTCLTSIYINRQKIPCIHNKLLLLYNLTNPGQLSDFNFGVEFILKTKSTDKYQKDSLSESVSSTF